MNKQIITVAAVALIAGAGLYFSLKPGDQEPGNPSTSGNSSASGIESGSGTPNSNDSRATASRNSRNRSSSENLRLAQLTERYGESKTNLSKTITTNVVGMFEEILEMAEMTQSGELGQAFGGPRAALRMSLGGLQDKLQLTEEQQAKLSEFYSEYQKREIENTRNSLEELKKSPEPLMELVLAGDAMKRGDLSEDEFRNIQESAGGELKGLLNPLDRNNFRGGQPLDDATFRDQLGTILEPSQKETYDAELAQRQAADEERKQAAGIEQMPAMEIEKLDSTIQSARKMTSGIRQMMEGMGGLQDLGPMMEGRRRQREGGENNGPSN